MKRPRASLLLENRPCVWSSSQRLVGSVPPSVCGSFLRYVIDTTHTIYYRGHWLRVRRSKKTDGSETEMLSIRYIVNYDPPFFSRLTYSQRCRPLKLGPETARASG